MITSSIKCYTEWYLGNQFNEHTEQFGKVMQVVVISSYLVRISIFLFMIQVFLRTLKYFVDLKSLVMKTQLLKLSCFNYFIISAVYLLTLVRVSDTMSTDVITIIRLVKDVHHDRVLEYGLVICRLLVLPLRDLSELLMICYMISYQEQRQAMLENMAP
jgi:hypothetical protein